MYVHTCQRINIFAVDLSLLPFGDPYTHKYYHDDPYGDAHPIFNKSRMAVIHLELSEEDLVYLFTPWNGYNQTWVKANFTFQNGRPCIFSFSQQKGKSMRE